MQDDSMNGNRPQVAAAPLWADGGIDLADLIAILWRRKRALAASVLAMVAVGVIYLVQAQPLYQVEARLLVEHQDRLPGEPSLPGRETQQEKNFLATQAEILRSPEVVRRAIERFGLRPPVEPVVDPVAAIIESLTVSPVLGTNVLWISFRSPNANEAARTVQGLVETYQQFVLERKQAAHVDTVRLLTETEQKLRGELETLEQAYRVRRQDQPVVAEASDEDTSRDKVSLISLTTGGEDQAKGTPGDGSPTIVPEADPNGRWNAAAIQEELARAEVRHMELSRSYGPKHPNVQAARQQIDIWMRLLSERLEAEPIQRAKAAHEVVLAELQGSKRTEQALAVGRSGLAVGLLQIPVKDPPPVWPPRALLLAACAAMGLMGGVGVIWLMERASPTKARLPQLVSTS
jgi:succinoglycan biosynthesis transport protein ExoP